MVSLSFRVDFEATTNRLAYFCNVASEGECFRRPPPASNRATTDGCVAMRLATSAWVSPASCRARSNSSNNANSCAKLSYSRTNSGSCRHSRSISSCVFIAPIFHPVFVPAGERTYAR